MARGDPTYCQVDVEIFPNGERFSTLSANEAFLYLALWALAVKVRSEVIPVDNSSSKWVSEWTHKGRKSVQRWMDKLATKGLITRNQDGSLTVHKVMACHKKLRWDKRPQSANRGQLELPSTRPETGGEIESPREREIKTDPDTEIEALRRADNPVPAGPPAGGGEPSDPGAVFLSKVFPNLEGLRTGQQAPTPDDEPAPWEVTPLERETEALFLELWPDGPYDWESEKASLLSQVRRYGLGAYNIAAGMLREDRCARKPIQNELAWVNKIAKEQTEKVGNFRQAKKGIVGDKSTGRAGGR